MRRARSLFAILSCCAGLLVAAGCSRSTADATGPTLVFAAANLREALADAADAYRAATGDSVVLVFGSTGDLATQIANGAPADLFLSANEAAVDSLATLGLVEVGSRTIYAVGRLALIMPCGAVPPGAEETAAPCEGVTLQELAAPRFRAIAIADPRYAPYGLAARQALERSGVWEAVRERIVMGTNVSQAEQFVNTGNADAGLVSLSLVRRAPGRPFVLVDSALHDPLTQAAAVIAGAAHAASASALLAFLHSEAGVRILERYGFTVPTAVSGMPANGTPANGTPE